jgi:hypothetical protein
VALGDETYKLNITNWNYKYNNYILNLADRSSGRRRMTDDLERIRKKELVV